VQLRLNLESGRAHFARVETCRNVWLCPVCSGRITEARRIELQQAVTTWVGEGGEIYLMTLTFPHVRRDRLVELVDKLRLALKKFNASPAMKRTRAATGHAGSVRALEVTWGSWHGWHPHVHVLWFGRAGQLEKLQQLEGPWIETLIKVGLADRSQLNDMLEAAFDVQNGDYAAKYIAKFGHEPSFRSQLTTGETWGAAREMVKGASKVGRRFSGSTPFTLLAVVDGKCKVPGLDAGCAAKLFCEFALAFKGERQLYWSPRLRKALRMGRLFDDAELAELEDRKPEVVTVCELNDEEWRLTVRHHCFNALLREVEENGRQAGAAAVAALLARLRAMPPPPTWERLTVIRPDQVQVFGLDAPRGFMR
jgi:hypothetical protein